MGRWILPNLKKLKFGYDIAPYPSEDGKTDRAGQRPGRGHGCERQGQGPGRLRCGYPPRTSSVERSEGSGSPAAATRCRRSRAAEDVVTEGNLPEHAAYFNEVAKVGYAIPLGHRLATPTVAANINAEIDKMIKAGADAQDVRRPRSAPSSTGRLVVATTVEGRPAPERRAARASELVRVTRR